MNKQENQLLTEIINQLRTIEGRVQRIEMGVYGDENNEIEGLIKMNRNHNREFIKIHGELQKLDKRISALETIKSLFMWVIGSGSILTLIIFILTKFITND
jgi:hypothetical protein